MSCLVAWVCLSAQVSAIVPTKDVETPFACLKTLTLASRVHSSQWTHGVFAVKCDYTSPKSKDDLYADLKKGFSKYLVLPERNKSGTAGWRIRQDGIDYRFRFLTTVDSVKSIDHGVTKLEVLERPHLTLEMSVPIEGQEPKRWWKEAILPDMELREFILDRSIRAVYGTWTQGGANRYAAVLDGSPEAWLSALKEPLRTAGYKKGRGGRISYLFYHPKSEINLIVISKLQKGSHTFDASRTSLEWSYRSASVNKYTVR